MSAARLGRRLLLAGLAGGALLTSLFPLRAADSPAAVVEVLSGVEFVASKPILDQTLGPSALADLIDIARGATETDPGVRIRAYRALALYQDSSAQSALVAAIAEHRAVPTGIESLYLRAAVESLALVAKSAAVPFIAPLLSTEANLDTRMAAARALAVCASASALPALRARLDVETSPQVRLAISDAIRDLSGL